MKIKSKQSTKNILTFFVACTLLLSSCKKGDTGPAGAQGPQGESAKPGPPATYIDIIANYTGSNVVFSFSTYGDSYKNAILVYFKDQANNNALVQTPFTWYNGTNSPVAYIWAEVEKSSCNCNDLVKIYAQKPNANQNTPAFTAPTQLAFRIVEIPVSFRTLPKDLSYESIKNEYNLKD